MKCTKCGKKTAVINVAKDVDEVIRLRECTGCKTCFYTAERRIDFNGGCLAMRQIRNYSRISRRKVKER